MVRKLLFLSIFLLFISAHQVYAGMLIGSGAVGSASVPDVVNETFDTNPGYDTGFSETVAGTNALDEDSTTQAVSGESADLDYNDTGNDNYAVATFTEQTSTTYARIKVYITDGFGAEWSNVYFYQLLDNANRCVDLRAVDAGSEARIYFQNDSGSGTSVNVAFGTWHTIVLKYNSDGSSMSQYKLNGGAAQDIANESNNRDPDRHSIGAEAAAISTTAQIYVEDLGVCSSSQSSLCGW